MYVVVFHLVSSPIRLAPFRLLEASCRLLVALADSVLLEGLCLDEACWAHHVD
jgi:hypothetical protein